MMNSARPTKEEPRRSLPGSKAPRIAMLCGKGAAAPLSYAEGWPLAVMFRPQQTEKGVGRTNSDGTLPEGRNVGF
jgi:hypothetical protein